MIDWKFMAIIGHLFLEFIWEEEVYFFYFMRNVWRWDFLWFLNRFVMVTVTINEIIIYGG